MKKIIDSILIYLKKKEVYIPLLLVLILVGVLVFKTRIQSLIGVVDTRIGIGTGKPLPKYDGRSIREIRENPEEVRLYTEEQKKTIRQKILDQAGSIDVNPDVLEPWLLLGVYKKGIGDYEGARDAWEYASLIRPLNVISFKNLGELYWHYLPDFPRAEMNLRTAIKNDPTYIDSYITLSDIFRYSYKEKVDAAGSILQDGLKNNPNNRDLTAYLARYYKEMGDKNKAIEYYKKLLVVEPQNAEVKAEIQKLESQK